MSKAKKFFAEAAVQAAAAQKAKEEAEIAEAKRIAAEEREAWREKTRQDPLSTLDTLLILALMEKFHGQVGITGKPKRFLEKVWDLKDRVKVAVVATVLDPIYRSPFPFKMLTQMTDHYVTLDETTQQFVEDGYQGLLIHEGLIYPVKLYAEDKEAHTWGKENEVQLMRMAAHVACAAFDIPTIQCHVLFFMQAGFSHRMGSVGHRVVDIKEAFPDQDEANVVKTIRVVG